jgi:ankyrin repeat protein
MLNNSANITVIDNNHQIPSLWAAEQGDEAVFQLLLDNGAVCLFVCSFYY